MTYCIDFFRKFKKEGNFCGLDKSQVSRLTAYLEIVELLMKQKIPEEQIYENFTVKAAEPLISAKGEAHTDGLNFVTAALKEGKKVTNKDIQGTLKSCTNATTIPPLRVEKHAKKKDNFNGTPQPGDYADQPATDPVKLSAAMTTPPPSPEASVRKEEMKEAAANQPANTPAAVPVQNPPQNVEEIPCKSGKPCPGDRNYLLKQEQLGNKCTACGALVRNVTVCPIIQRQKAAQANAGVFTTAAALIKPSVERAPDILPRAAQNQPMELTIRFSGKQWAILKQVGREQQLSIEEAVLFLVDEAGERMESAN